MKLTKLSELNREIRFQSKDIFLIFGFANKKYFAVVAAFAIFRWRFECSGFNFGFPSSNSMVTSNLVSVLSGQVPVVRNERDTARNFGFRAVTTDYGELKYDCRLESSYEILCHVGFSRTKYDICGRVTEVRYFCKARIYGCFVSHRIIRQRYQVWFQNTFTCPKISRISKIFLSYLR